MASEDAGTRVDQNGIIESEGFDAGGDLRNLRVGVRPRVAGQRYQLVDQPQFDMLHLRLQGHGDFPRTIS